MTQSHPPAGRQVFKTSEADIGKRLDVFLAEQLPELSRSRIQQLLEQGNAGIEGQSESAAKASFRLRGGERLWIEAVPPPPLHATPEKIELNILYEDDDVAAIDKPAGMIVHAGAGVHSGTLVNALLHHFGKLSEVSGELRPGIVHRLDKNTSGVILVAKNDVAHRHLAEQFSGRRVEKEYIALVHGTVQKAEGAIDLAIGRDPVRRIRMSVKSGTAADKGRHALSRYRVLKRYRGFTLLAVRILTGRTHQIRVHLSAIGHPIVGDTLYGAPGAIQSVLLSATAQNKDSAQQQEPTLERNFLHAARLRFEQPRNGVTIEIRAPIPVCLEAFLAKLQPVESGDIVAGTAGKR